MHMCTAATHGQSRRWIVSLLQSAISIPTHHPFVLFSLFYFGLCVYVGIGLECAQGGWVGGRGVGVCTLAHGPACLRFRSVARGGGVGHPFGVVQLPI